MIDYGWYAMKPNQTKPNQIKKKAKVKSEGFPKVGNANGEQAIQNTFIVRVFK